MNGRFPATDEPGGTEPRAPRVADRTAPSTRGRKRQNDAAYFRDGTVTVRGDDTSTAVRRRAGRGGVSAGDELPGGGVGRAWVGRRGVRRGHRPERCTSDLWDDCPVTVRSAIPIPFSASRPSERAPSGLGAVECFGAGGVGCLQCRRLTFLTCTRPGACGGVWSCWGGRRASGRRSPMLRPASPVGPPGPPDGAGRCRIPASTTSMPLGRRH